MYPKSLTYYRAKDVEDACRKLLSTEGARVIAGGQSIMPMLKLRIAGPPLLVDLCNVGDLKLISQENDSLTIGSMVIHRDILDNQVIRKNVPVLASTAAHIADVQIRNRGTIGGSLCEADPSADYIPTLLCLNAKVVLRSLKKERTVALEDFIKGPFETAIEDGEILTSVIVEKNSDPFVVEKYARRSADFAVASVAAIVRKDQKGTPVDIRVAVGAQDEKPIRMRNLEKIILSGKPSRDKIGEIIDSEVENLSPIDDLHGGAEYRREVTANILKSRLSSLLYGGETR